MRKIFLTILLLILLYLGLGKFYYHLTGDFRSGNILTESPAGHLETAPDLQHILSQPFTFLDHGNQTFAFISQDRKYVLKLFKKETLDRSWLNHIFPAIPPTRQFVIRKGEDRLKKMERIFVGYQLAYDLDRENTGLIYIHMSPSKNSFGIIRVKDRLGLSHEIDLDKAVFVLQKKGIPTKTVLKDLLDKGDLAKVQEKIDQILQMTISEYQKGLIDQDHNVLDNTGFVEGKPIRLDVGKLTYDEAIKNPENYKKDLEKVKARFNNWLKK